MSNVLPMPFGAAGPQSLGTRVEAAPVSPGRVLRVEFTGSGSEYFRIWIVNLLLTLVTFGLYYPWAKVRRLRYFYGNTVVGEHALDFHGDPKRMLRGFLLVGLLLGLYSMAGHVSPTAGLIAFTIIAAVWPALFRASMRFKLANTSWRGLRFQFTGEMGDAYRAILPLFIPGAIVLAAAALGPDPQTADPAAVRSAGMLVLCAMGAALLTLPWCVWLLKRYQHNHYALGKIQTELRTGAGSFYLLSLKALGVGLMAAFIVGAAVGVLVSIASFSGPFARSTGFLIGFGVAYAVTLLVMIPYATSRTQNLVWGGTESRDARFESTLAFLPLLGLTAKNFLLMLITLGFYWPFAKIAVTRRRLSALSVVTSGNPDLIIGVPRGAGNDAAGDAAGDLFGIDIGL
jgi:uncharacterized membrane protein YjgN (DUF898 family)